MMTTYDFGYGLVPAHRHTNPDGSEGGWVADTAWVDDTAWVAERALVFGSARVYNSARVYGNADVIAIVLAAIF